MTAFEEFGVLPELAKAIDEMEWTLPTDVQAEAIPLILGGGDVLMAAETGSGKTGAFCLPILQIVWETLKDIQEGKTSKVIAQTSSEWTMSFFDRNDALAVTPDGLRCQSRDQKMWHGCRATKGVHTKGAYYYEAIVTDEGLCRVGRSTQASRSARAVFQFYPQNETQLELLTSQAMKAGFYGGVVIDYPNSTKAKKFFLVLMTGGSAPLPKALGTEEENSLQVKYARREAGRNARGKPMKNTKAWLLEKKERRRQQGKETKPDTKYTGRKRSGRF